MLNWAKANGKLESYTGGNVSYSEQILLDATDIYCQITYSGGQFVPEIREGFDMATHPVVEVTWYGSVVFCNWLSEKECRAAAYNLTTWELVSGGLSNGGYRLPTEAEWERAAGWDGSKHWIYGFTSDTISNSRCNYNNNKTFNLSSYPHTSPVGWFDGVNVNPKGGVQTQNSISPVGVYDLSGNVWEWCHDWEGIYGSGVQTNPTGLPSGTSFFRVMRGSSWSYNGHYGRSADRGGSNPDSRGNDVGFRVVRSSP